MYSREQWKKYRNFIKRFNTYKTNNGVIKFTPLIDLPKEDRIKYTRGGN